MICTFEIVTEWPAVGRSPMEEGTIDISQSSNEQKDLIVAHIDHV